MNGASLLNHQPDGDHERDVGRFGMASRGAFSEKSVTKLSVSITCEALTVFGAEIGFDKLLELMKARKPVKLKYGFAAAESNDKHEEGKFVITSLEQNSPADDDATYSATFENCGLVETKTGGA